MITVPSKRFYVYTLCLPDGTPFYVGKGSGARIFHHVREAFRGTCTCEKCETIRAVWLAGQDIQHNVVSEFDDEESAYRAEYELIASIGRDRLVNIVDGRKFPVFGPRPPMPVIEYQTWGRGSVVLRKDGRWMACLGFTLKSGKYIRKYAYARTKEAAEAKLETLKQFRDRLVDVQTYS